MSLSATTKYSVIRSLMEFSILFPCISTGLILLFASGTQIYWTIQELLYNDEDDDKTAILLWYFGAVVGGCIGARMVDKFLKSTIYVMKLHLPFSCSIQFSFCFYFAFYRCICSILALVC